MALAKWIAASGDENVLNAAIVEIVGQVVAVRWEILRVCRDHRKEGRKPVTVFEIWPV